MVIVRQRLKGFTLIEVLISVLIMSVGVLGATGLQLRGLEANRNAFYRTEATQLTSDISSRIRINSATTYAVDLGATPAFSTNCRTANCTPAQMAAFDIAQWLCSIKSTNGTDTYPACSTLNITGSLPGGQASISLPAGAAEYSVLVRWTDAKTSVVSSVNLFVAVP